MPLFFFTRFIVPKNVLIKGDVDTGYSCSINGNIEGSLRSEKHVHIKKGALLKGNVYAKKVKIEGTVWGDVHAADLSVLPGGLVKGKLLSVSIRIHEKGIVEDVEAVQPITTKEAIKTDSRTWF